jgi:hypothetical protein
MLYFTANFLFQNSTAYIRFALKLYADQRKAKQFNNLKVPGVYVCATHTGNDVVDCFSALQYLSTWQSIKYLTAINYLLPTKL